MPFAVNSKYLSSVLCKETKNNSQLLPKYCKVFLKRIDKNYQTYKATIF